MTVSGHAGYQMVTRVAIFSTATLERDGLRLMLEQASGVEVSGVTGCWTGLLEHVQGGVDVAVIDRDDQVPAGFLHQLFDCAPSLRVVILDRQTDQLAVYTQMSIDAPRRPQLLQAVLARPLRPVRHAS
jgi:DNA-binding NarL/FixJ family response regulator